MEQGINKRIHWIDVARGLAIICVVFGHASIPVSLECFIYSFHMPLFFFISGIVFSAKRDFIPFVKNKVMALLLPWLVMSGVDILFDTVWEALRGNIVGVDAAFVNIVHRVIGLVLGFRFAPVYMDSFWFIKVIFICSLIAWLLERRVHAIKIKVAILILISILSVWIQSSFFSGKALPWSIDIVPVAFSFLYGGILYKQIILKKCYKVYKKSNLLNAGILILLIIGQIVLSALNSDMLNINIDMYEGKLHNPVLFLVGAWLGICLVIYAAKNLIYENRTIEWCGQNTILIYLSQSSLLAVFYQIFKIFPILYDGGCVSMIVRGILLSFITILIVFLWWKIDKKRFHLLARVGLAKQSGC